MISFKYGRILITVAIFGFVFIEPGISQSWTADNGNGTFTNPIFYEEFSDPDLIRVGDDYYLTGTTMHTMPGLPLLHSKDLVNWELMSYAAKRLDFGPAYHLEEGNEIYGQGIWAPSLRYHDGTFYIVTNINNVGTQIYSTTDPRGPWQHHSLDVSLHDPSFLFDDDGKVYAIWDYNEIKMVEMEEDLSAVKPGTERVIIPENTGAGEGVHFYKIDGKYHITITNYDPVCYQLTARADRAEGPYEFRTTSAKESMGISTSWRMYSGYDGNPFNIIPPQENTAGCIPQHQGGIVETQTGEWWGFSMMDYNSIGRVLTLSPVTWEDGWPYFGLPGNLSRAPRTWVKPNTGFEGKPKALFQRNDDFSNSQLNPIWQWNHHPVEDKWQIDEERESLKLTALPAKNFWWAKNTLTQRAVGPESIVTTELNASELKDGDVAGLALLNLPYAWLGIEKNDGKLAITHFDQRTETEETLSIGASKIWLRAHADFDNDLARFSYSTDNETFHPIGKEFIMVYQLKTFQGVRYSLFAYNKLGQEGGTAEFMDFDVHEPRPNGYSKPIPHNQTIKLTNFADSSVVVRFRHYLRPVPQDHELANSDAALFKVVNRGKGRVALRSVIDNKYVTVTGKGLMAEVRFQAEDGGDASTFQWIDMLRDDLMLLSLKTNRYINTDPSTSHPYSADAPGAAPNRKGGAVFTWEIVE